jgi:hypothetical protein
MNAAVPSSAAPAQSAASRTSMFQCLIRETETKLVVEIQHWYNAPEGWGMPLPEALLAIDGYRDSHQHQVSRERVQPHWVWAGDFSAAYVTHNKLPDLGDDCTLPLQKMSFYYRIYADYSVNHLEATIKKLREIDEREPLEAVLAPRGTKVRTPAYIRQCLYFDGDGVPVNANSRFQCMKLLSGNFAPQYRRGYVLVCDFSITELRGGGLYLLKFTTHNGNSWGTMAYLKPIPGGLCMIQGNAKSRRENFYPCKNFLGAGQAVQESPRNYMTFEQFRLCGYTIEAKVIGHNTGSIAL